MCRGFRANGFVNNLLHCRGVISMARYGYDVGDVKAVNSASCQFFIMHADIPASTTFMPPLVM